MRDSQAIAIVGIGGILPASPDLGSFWSHVVSGVDTAREPPAGRWALDPQRAYHPEQGKPDRVYSGRACFLEEFVLDDSGLSIDPEFCRSLDPLIHLALQAGRDAWNDAVHAGIDRSKVGVILGNIALPTESASALCDQLLGRRFEERLFATAGISPQPDQRTQVAAINRWVSGLPAGMLARALGLGGTHYTLDAACASSLYAIKLAAEELRSGRADAMLTGGLARPDSLYTQMGFSQLFALSPSGRCAPFDLKGDGIVVGEGAAIFLLKRLADAERDGDKIYGLIRGIGLSNDVDGNLLAPSSEGQLRAMQAAYTEAGWEPSDVDLIECHATGTPIGDLVEHQSLRALWGEQGWQAGQCVIGAVKSNVGHLLTGAGVAGLLKVLLALQHEVLPPTANFERAAEGIDLEHGPFRVLQREEEWQPREPDLPRRAVVSGFGFGGTNAHLLLEEYRPAATAAVAVDQRLFEAKPIAIVGLAVSVGPWDDLQSFQQRVLGGDEQAEPKPKQNFWGFEDPPSGWFIEQLQVPFGSLRIPPSEIAEILPQQTLMLQVAGRALEDAEFSTVDRLRTGVFIGIDLDLGTTDYQLRWRIRQRAPGWAEELGLESTGPAYEEWVEQLCESAGPPLNANRTMGGLGSIVASRVAREFGLGGASHVFSGEEGAGLTALDAAIGALRRGELDSAVVGAVDLVGDLRSIRAGDSLKPYSRSGHARPFDRAAEGAVPGEGAAAVVLKRADDARQAGDRSYALIRGQGSSTAGSTESLQPAVAGYRSALERAYAEAQVDPATVGLVETHGSGYVAEDEIEAEALSLFFGESTSTAIASAKADVGHTGAAAALVSLVKASLCLYQEILPPLRGLQEPCASLKGWLLPRQPQYWWQDAESGPRRAAVSSISLSGGCNHLVLEAAEGAAREEERLAPLGQPSEALFAIEAETEAELLDRLQQLSTSALAAASSVSLTELAGEWWREQGSQTKAPLGIGLVARSPAELNRLAEAARALIVERAEPDSDEAERIFFERQPLGSEGQLAFVFPGSGSRYPGMGREIALRQPQLARRYQEHSRYARSQFKPELIWNGKHSLDAAAPRELILSQVALGKLLSDLLRSFGVEPAAVIGYSLGESTGLCALEAWTDPDEIYRRMLESDLFTTQLCGPAEAARQCWGLNEAEEVVWIAGLVASTAAEVREALQGVPDAYLLIVNAPSECLIGGREKAVQAVVEKLGGRWLPLPAMATVHCEVAAQVESAYHRLHLLPAAAVPGVRFYSGAAVSTYEVSSEAAADSILAQATSGLDFPRLIDRAYQDGIRIFVETGPGASCTRMISKILAGRRFAARSVCVEGQDEFSSTLRLLAMLLSERVAVDLSPLYRSAQPLVAHELSKELLVQVGRSGFAQELPLPSKAALPAFESQESAAHQMFAPPETGPSLAPGLGAAGDRSGTTSALVQGMIAASAARAAAHAAYLKLANRISEGVLQQARLQLSLSARSDCSLAAGASVGHPQSAADLTLPQRPPRALDREQCLEFAVGSIGKVLGESYAAVDSHPTRVRLPDEPLMLVDRILEIDAEPHSMSSGRLITEHDVHEGAWYLDSGRIPTCIAVEAGQADLFLSAYLGIDSITRGLAVYRLLDAVVTFHSQLPLPGQTIRYEISIERFLNRGDTWLFWFQFDATVNGQLLMTMREGCAGFFTQHALDAGQGIVQSRLDSQKLPGKLPEDWKALVPMKVESLDEQKLEALREGDLATAFGESFAGLELEDPLTIPAGRMRLVHRVEEIDPQGGRYGIGSIRALARIDPADWFLTCHFVDDRVMPGTLMYECCLHTLRIFLLRMGWIGEAGQTVCQPVPGVKSRLKCRGQVIESTNEVTYELSIKELGYSPEPFAIVDALMYADGKPIVEIGDMSLRIVGTNFEKLSALWAHQAVQERPASKPALYDTDQLESFSRGYPSKCFGESYKEFDGGEPLACLPRPPFLFVDRITEVKGEPLRLESGMRCEAQLEVAPDAWYFASNRQHQIPFAVLLEAALQPCGWLAAYGGSAFYSESELRFRNLGGEAVMHAPVLQEEDLLTTRVELTEFSQSVGMIIQRFAFSIFSLNRGKVYEGKTYFGFFSPEALAQQVGLTDLDLYGSGSAELERGAGFEIPTDAPFPDERMRMLRDVDLLVNEGGPKQLGFLRGSIPVRPDYWFFDAHFLNDPVWPGSLGIEAFLQLLKTAAARRWAAGADTQFSTVMPGVTHSWSFRGQVLPGCEKVEVDASIVSVDDERQALTADGILKVDGLPIYQLNNFALEITE